MRNLLFFFFLAIVISQAFAFVTKLVEKSVSDKQKKQQSKKDEMRYCYEQYSTPLNLDGVTGNSSISLEDGSSCFVFSFTVPSGLSDDLTFNFSTANSSFFSIDEMDLFFDDDWRSDSHTRSFSFPARYLTGTGTGFTIPYCALRTGKWWAAGSITGIPVTTMSISKVTATPPLTGTMAGYSATGVSLEDADLPFYYFLQVPTTLEQSYDVNLTVSSNNLLAVTAWGSDYYCPTEAHSVGSTEGSFSGSGGNSVRTTSKESTIYFLVKIENTKADVSNWSLNLTFLPVTCKVPSGVYNDPCDLNYPMYPEDLNLIYNTQYQISYIPLLGNENEAPGRCVSAALALACGIAFPKCDDNGYAQYPCEQNCKAVSYFCTKPKYGIGDSAFIPQSNCPPVPQNAPTFCYSSGNMVLASYTILVISLLFFLF